MPDNIELLKEFVTIEARGLGDTEKDIRRFQNRISRYFKQSKPINLFKENESVRRLIFRHRELLRAVQSETVHRRTLIGVTNRLTRPNRGEALAAKRSARERN